MKTNTKKRIEEDPDFILSPRYDFSMARMIERYPDGVPPHLIAGALGITEEELQEEYNEIVQTLREKMAK